MTTRRSKAKSAFGVGIFPESEEPRIEDRNESSPPAWDTMPSERPDSSSSNESDDARSSRRRGVRNKKYENSSRRNPRDASSVPGLGAVGKHGEPLCLAELLAQERNRGFVEPDYDETYEKLKQSGDATYLSELEKMPMPELVAEARKQCCLDETEETTSRRDLVFRILKNRIRQNGLMFGEGTLEILPDQFGFLRSSEYHYLSSPDDIYISPSQIRRFGLRPGCTVSGQIRPPKENERYFALLRVEAVNHEEPGLLNSRPAFETLTPVYPNRQIVMTTGTNDFDMRILDRFIPVGFGQRGLIFGPPKSGKTTLIRKMALSALQNYPDLNVFVLLIDERPEEATEMIRLLKGSRCEVICTLFDEPASRHIHVAEVVLEKAKRMVEYGKDVIVFLESISQLTRAWNARSPHEGNAVSGISESLKESWNMQPPKKFFSSARKAEEGGSLTIMTTVPTETGNDHDDAVLKTFQGTGNLEIHLDRELADKRIWPALNMQKCNTRHEEFLLSDPEFQESSALRRRMTGMPPDEAIEFLRIHLQ